MGNKYSLCIYRGVISTWCQRDGGGATVATLSLALRRIDRADVAEDAAADLLSDCRQAAARGVSFSAAAASAAETEQRLKALTIQDLEAARRGDPLPKYDAIVLHGQDEEDVAFAEHLVERLESAGKKVFLVVCLHAGTLFTCATVFFPSPLFAGVMR